MNQRTLAWLGCIGVLTVCASILFSLASRHLNEGRAKATFRDAASVEIRPGMGPNLMVPPNYNSTDELVDSISADFDSTWTDGPSRTVRYMSVLVAGEGCRSYVDHGDGIWQPTDNSINVADDGISNNPFDGHDPFSD